MALTSVFIILRAIVVQIRWKEVCDASKCKDFSITMLNIFPPEPKNISQLPLAHQAAFTCICLIYR